MEAKRRKQLTFGPGGGTYQIDLNDKIAANLE